MAGIGFSLHKLLAEDRLGSNVRGLLHATVIAAGPWLFTSVALLLMHAMAKPWLGQQDMLQLSSLTLIVFSVSLTVAGPLTLVMSRKLADAVHAKRVDGVTPMMLSTLGTVFALLAVAGFLIFGVLTDLPWSQRVLGFALVMACGGVWVTSSMMSALRSHGAVTMAFASGLLVACAGTWLTVADGGLPAVLMSLLAGLTLVCFALAARVMGEFPVGREGKAFDLPAAVAEHDLLAWAGLFYCAGLWVDEWVMWSAGGAMSAGAGLWTHPAYETAMFYAILTMVPVMTLLLIDVETRFHATYQRYFRDIAKDATLRGIRRNHGALLRFAAESMQRLVLIQVVIAAVCVIAAPAIVASVGGGESMASAFRFGVMGAAFHMMLIVAMAALAYFDQPRWMVAASMTFFAANLILTWTSSWLGEAFHGWGYAIAALLGFAVAYYGAASTLSRLPYVTFVSGNTAVRGA